MRNHVRGALTVAALCLATMGFAQQGTIENQTVRGTVVTVADNTLVVRTEDGRTMTFNRDATIVVPDGLKGGDRIEARYVQGAGPDDFRLTGVTRADETRPPSDRNNGVNQGTDLQRANQNDLGDRIDDDRDATSAMGATGTLPRTAGPVMVGVILGAIALGGSLVMRRRRRRP